MIVQNIKNNISHSKLAQYISFLVLSALLSACATNSAKHSITTLERGRDTTKMIVMPLDMELYEISVGGIPQLKAEWTEKLKKQRNAPEDWLKTRN